MATRGRQLVLLAALALVLGGCAPRGVLFTQVTTPHMLDFDRTATGERRCVIDDHRIKDVVTGSGVSVEWTETAIRRAAESCGITVLHHTDAELFSVLFGVYERRRLIVYGD